MHSFLVLQHIRPAVGLAIAERLAWLVGPGGVGVLQVPLAGGTRAERAYQWARRAVPFVVNAANVVRRRPWAHPDMQMHAYPLNLLLLALRRRGIASVRTLVLDGGARPTTPSCVLVFARP